MQLAEDMAEPRAEQSSCRSFIEKKYLERFRTASQRKWLATWCIRIFGCGISKRQIPLLAPICSNLKCKYVAKCCATQLSNTTAGHGRWQYVLWVNRTHHAQQACQLFSWIFRESHDFNYTEPQGLTGQLFEPFRYTISRFFLLAGLPQSVLKENAFVTVMSLKREESNWLKNQ